MFLDEDLVLFPTKETNFDSYKEEKDNDVASLTSSLNTPIAMYPAHDAPLVYRSSRDLPPCTETTATISFQQEAAQVKLEAALPVGIWEPEDWKPLETVTSECGSDKADDGNIHDYSHVGALSEKKLITATMVALETGSLTPLVKEELKYTILSRRVAEGKPDIDVNYFPAKKQRIVSF